MRRFFEQVHRPAYVLENKDFTFDLFGSDFPTPEKNTNKFDMYLIISGYLRIGISLLYFVEKWINIGRNYLIIVRNSKQMPFKSKSKFTFGLALRLELKL